MNAPAAAALVLAALAALPCRGTDADSSSNSSNTQNRTESSPPTINKVYQMLHTPDVLNQAISKTNPSNLPSLKDSINRTCCREGESNNFKGAHFVHNALDKRNKKRAVSVINADLETTTIVIPSPPLMTERRHRKHGETGSSAPLLNYIFDTYSNTHHHKNDSRPGNGNGIYTAAAPEIEALVGSTANLDCKVDALHDKVVSWVRRKNDQEPMELLTTGTQQYTADDRYSARFIPPDIWRLQVKEVRPTDAAYYDCQLSAHPPRTARVTLRVPEVSVRIVDGAGAKVSEQVCELGSTVALRCEVRGLKMEGGPSLLWFRRDTLLNDDTTRGGISVRTEFGLNGANSVLRVARVRGNDAGRYTCSVARAPPPAPPPAQVILHVIKGESLAELHQGGRATRTFAYATLMVSALVVLLV
ncbi:cell adhesion molecule DSCAM-like isoform X1 [Cydia splendana]|uniref:cell adhesion molecule DSCAM-like isoform X1 n=1 Tax=Cydia splendana TaxID=1100963 RepID=UPI0021351FEB